MMSSLMESATTPPLYLILAGLVMIFAMATSKKAQHVIQTSVDLSRQDEGDEMFGSSRAARAIVRCSLNLIEGGKRLFPAGLRRWVGTRFNTNEVELQDDKAAFDVVRAAINLVIASMLITFGTNHQLPLSTTYVTFMVAMGTSLADRAWSRESAVFRVTGVLSVIGGWFITAGVAFIACALVCLAMWFGGVIVQCGFMALVVFLLYRSNRQYKAKSAKAKQEDDTFRLMMRTRDPELVWEMLRSHVRDTQSTVCKYIMEQYNAIVEAFATQNVRALRQSQKSMRRELDLLKKYRRQEMLGLRRSPMDLAIERNTWFHVGINSDQQYVYTLRRMLAPIKEHVDNNFNPLDAIQKGEFSDVAEDITYLIQQCRKKLENNDYQNMEEEIRRANDLNGQLSQLKRKELQRIQSQSGSIRVSMVYLTMVQEAQNVVTYIINLMKVSRKFQMETEMP